MGISYRCDPSAGLAVNVFDGEITFATWFDHVRRQLEDPAWLATTKGLADMSGAHFAPLTDAEAARIEALYRRRPDRATARLMAMIGGRSWEAAHGLEAPARRLLASAIVFNEVSTACVWLGVDGGTVRVVIAELRAELRGVKPAG